MLLIYLLHPTVTFIEVIGISYVNSHACYSGCDIPEIFLK